MKNNNINYYVSVTPRMPEANLIIPYCFIQGKTCPYDSGLVDGYLLGLATMFIVYMLIQCIKSIETECDGPIEMELEEDEESVEDVEEDVEKEQIEEKLDEDKKDD